MHAADMLYRLASANCPGTFSVSLLQRFTSLQFDEPMANHLASNLQQQIFQMLYDTLSKIKSPAKFRQILESCQP
jgi:hypothetical protein